MALPKMNLTTLRVTVSLHGSHTCNRMRKRRLGIEFKQLVEDTEKKIKPTYLLELQCLRLQTR